MGEIVDILFDNPITMSFNLLDSYKKLLKVTLQDNNLSSIDVEAVLKNIDVDQGVLFSLNRKYEQSKTSFTQFCASYDLHDTLPDHISNYNPISKLYIHQEDTIRSILKNKPTIISTGTGSGKTESFFIPIINHCLKNPGQGIKTIVIYPMNALASDQLGRMAKWTENTDITFGIYIGSTPENRAQSPEEEAGQLNKNHLIYREDIRRTPPNILITNYVMLDWMLTDLKTRMIFTSSRTTVRYIVIDEIHTYRGNKATHLKYLLNRLRFILNDEVIPIGSSATLRKRSNQPGYLGGESLDEFIKPLLNISNYNLIEPTYVTEPDITPNPMPTFSNDHEYGWRLAVNNAIAFKNLSQLTGETYSEFDLKNNDFTRSKPYKALQQDAFVLEMQKVLLTGSQSFLDLVNIFQRVSPFSITTPQAENAVKAYLSAISYINHNAKEKPLLDFRIHLFLKDIGGYLKKCIKCKKYHSGFQEFCQQCGFPLFHVYKHDINKCIGKVTGHSLKYHLRPESDDKKNSFYVLISFDAKTQPKETTLGFSASSATFEEQIILDYNEYGQLCLELFPAIKYDQIEDNIISLIDGTKDYQYLHQLVKSVLDANSDVHKKLLGFIDNREKASRFGSVLKDEFAEQFFVEFLKLHYPSERKLNLVDTLKHLQNNKPIQEGLNDLEIKVFKELPLWYARFISIPARSFESKKKLLVLKNSENFDSFERELLEIFINERAIAKDFIDDIPDGSFIRFYRYWATDYKGIHCEEGQASNDSKYQSISLSKDAREYGTFVKEHDPKTQIIPVIQSLVHDRIILKRQTPDGKTHYQLNPKHLYFDLSKPMFEDYKELRDQFLLTAAVHSSELKNEQRRIVENKFKKGDINFLLATPTLELGIDIGNLQNVLMIGVPPLPSNYAQRAGRSGRGSGNNYALLITFCSEISNHDIYYFNQPQKMINGIISPPSFNPTNAEVIKKHINAFVLSDVITDLQEIKAFLKNMEVEIKQEMLGKVQQVLGDAFDVETYLLSGEFKEQLNTLIKKADYRQGSIRQICYSEGIFPDYAFRKDQVSIVDKEQLVQKKIADGILDRFDIDEYSLSKREPELAYYKFAPNETVFIAGEIYKIQPECSGYDRIGVEQDKPIRAYSYFEATKQTRYASKSKVRRKYALSITMEGDALPSPLNDKYKVLNITYYESCKLFFRNKGVVRYGDVETFYDGEEEFIVGYNLEREAIVLEFDKQVCADQKHYLSLVSALDRTIKDTYGLDESEVRLIVDVKPKDTSIGTDKIYVVCYDFHGNGNIPLKKVFENFHQVVRHAHQKIQDCECKQGCYYCMKSYNTHVYADNVDKKTGFMFTGYLLGKNRFEPSISETEITGAQVGLILRVEQQGGIFRVKSEANGKEYIAQATTPYNKTIFQLITKAVTAEFTNNIKTLKILSNLKHIVDAINKGHIKTDKEAFAALQFNLLRFKQVTAEKG